MSSADNHCPQISEIRWNNFYLYVMINLRSIQLFLITALCFLAFHPEADAQRFKGGLVAGINLSQLDGDRLAGFNHIGVNAGGRVAAILSDRWQLSMELLFSQQGSKRTLNDDPGAVFEKIDLNMVEVPVMINFLEWKFHVSAGVSYGRLINFKAEDVFGEDVSDTQSFNENLFLAIVSATFYFDEHFGLNVGWSRALNNLQAEGGAGRLISRNVIVRGVYMF